MARIQSNTERAVVELYRAVWAGLCPREVAEWQCRVVSITSTRPTQIGFEVRESPNCIVTKFSSELSWLMSYLVDSFSPEPGTAKAEGITERLAARAQRHLSNGGWRDDSERPLLMEVLDEACSILEEADRSVPGRLARFQCSCSSDPKPEQGLAQGNGGSSARKGIA